MNKRFKNKYFYGGLVLLLAIVLFIGSFYGSFFVFSSNYHFGLRDLRSKVLKSGEEELVLTSSIDYDEETWNLIYEENTSKEPFTNCASRLSEGNYTSDIQLSLFDVPVYSDINYSFNHIYGYNYVWPKLTTGQIVVSSTFLDKYPEATHVYAKTITGEVKSFNIIGYCEGKINNDRSHLGNIFADSFGFYGFITQEDMSALNVNGYIKVLSTKQTARSFNLETQKWISNYGINYKNTSFSSKSINNMFAFYLYTSSHTNYIFVGVLLLILAASVFVLELIVIKKNHNNLSKRTKIVVCFVFLVLWVISLLIFSNIVLSIGSNSIMVSNTGAMIFPSLFLLVLFIYLLFKALPLNSVSNSVIPVTTKKYFEIHI